MEMASTEPDNVQRERDQFELTAQRTTYFESWRLQALKPVVIFYKGSIKTLPIISCTLTKKYLQLGTFARNFKHGKEFQKAFN